MTVPGYVDDGLFSVAQQNGAPEYSFPFVYRGDTKTFRASVKFRVDVDSYKPPVPMSQKWFKNLGNAYLVAFEQPTMLGQGLMEWSEVYANIPARGEEQGTTTYAIQRPVIAPFGEDSYITAYTATFDALYVYEYSVFKPLPQLFYAHFMMAPFALPPDNFSAVFVVGDTAYSNTNTAGVLLALSQNSTSKIYAGQIYERLTVWAKLDLAQTTPRILVIPPP